MLSLYTILFIYCINAQLLAFGILVAELSDLKHQVSGHSSFEHHSRQILMWDSLLVHLLQVKTFHSKIYRIDTSAIILIRQ